MLPCIVPADFEAWGKECGAAAAREHLERKVIRFAHIVGNQGADFAGASFTEALLVIYEGKLIKNESLESLREDWKQLVRLSSPWGRFRSLSYRTDLFGRVCRMTWVFESQIEKHTKQADRASA